VISWAREYTLLFSQLEQVQAGVHPGLESELVELQLSREVKMTFWGYYL